MRNSQNYTARSILPPYTVIV